MECVAAMNREGARDTCMRWERVSLSFCTAPYPCLSYQHTDNTLSFRVRDGGRTFHHNKLKNLCCFYLDVGNVCLLLNIKLNISL